MIEILAGVALIALIGAGVAWRACFGDDIDRSSSIDGVFGDGDSAGGDGGD